MTAGSIGRAAYVGLWRSARRAAQATGALGALDRRGRAHPGGLAAHARSLFAIHDAADLVALDVPWWTYGAAARVEERLAELGGSARVFEYGSGASSVWLARRAARVTSVEHHAGFAALVRDLARDAGVADRLELLEVAPGESRAPVVPSGRRGEEGLDYAAYVRAIDRVPGELDVVVVDGRARAARQPPHGAWHRAGSCCWTTASVPLRPGADGLRPGRAPLPRLGAVVAVPRSRRC
ncbi:class I SAM-dependent methyltransferase [Cellulomonas endometrii]|uniref:class I SAM-dependent methyltransferase n=1 Tax=Cellulomonas endometrii TaxID=3036301 RepID=UPI0024ADC752|nr:class I SAM-dependent methyltransferase [Cellulomonas endometrii]